MDRKERLLVVNKRLRRREGYLPGGGDVLRLLGVVLLARLDIVQGRGTLMERRLLHVGAVELE